MHSALGLLSRRTVAGNRPTDGCRQNRSAVGDARRAPAPVRYRPDVDTHAESKDSGRKPDSKGTRRTLKGPCIVKLRGLQSGSHAMPFQADRTANLGTYMSHAAEQLSHIPLGAGGKMKRVDGNHVEIVVPKLELFDVWLQPHATATITVLPTRADVTSGTFDCVLHGSHHVQQLKLNERFNVDVRITFTWEEGVATRSPRMSVKGDIQVEVDIPPPFSLMPQPMLKAGGDAAVTGVLMVLMPAFMDKLAEDYARWAKAVPHKAP